MSGMDKELSVPLNSLDQLIPNERDGQMDKEVHRLPNSLDGSIPDEWDG